MMQSPMALLMAVYLASGPILAFVVITLTLLFRMRRQLERVVLAVEECKAELIPLARDARVVMGNLRDLSGRARWGLDEIDNLIDKARGWSGWAGHVGERVGAAVKSPVRAMSRKLHALLTGVKAFATVISHGGNHE